MKPMKQLKIGDKVRILSGIPAFHNHTGRIDRITHPFVTNEPMKSMALQEMPLYCVLLDDGRNFRFRGKDLELLNTFTPVA
jgi:hypothetical protein